MTRVLALVGLGAVPLPYIDKLQRANALDDAP